MNKTMKQYKGKVLKAMMMLLAVGFALAGTSTLSSCSSDDDPYFTVSEDDNPRILNTDLADSKIDRKTNYKLEIKVTPVHYTTVTWLLDGTQIAEGNTIDQTLPVGNHTLKIVATTTKGKSTSRTLNVTVTPAADDPALGTNAVELWVAPGAETTIHKCKNLGTVTKVMVGGKEVAFEVLGAAPAPGAALAISFFIIAPQKNRVNPKARFCKDFYRKARNQCNIQTAYLRYAIQRCCRCIKKLNCNTASYRNKTPFSVLRRTEKGVLLGYCLGVRRNHVTWEVVAAPLPMAKV